MAEVKKLMCDLWDKGHLVGQGEYVLIDTMKVLITVAPVILNMKEAAAKVGIFLSLGAGIRTREEQVYLRRKNCKRKRDTFLTEKEYNDFIDTAEAFEFKPATGKPGYSNHHDGKAYDFNVTGKPKVYKWLVENALKFGFIRTVKSKYDAKGKLIQEGERWHWEYIPGEYDMFAFVPKTDPTWDGLVK